VASDFYAEVDTVHREGPLNNQFGLIFRYIDPENFYLFSIGSDGYYSFKALIDNEWVSLIEWTESEVIEVGEGAENTLAVLADGPSITLLVNDFIVDRFEDDTLSEGKLAFGAGAYDQPGVDIGFDNFAVWLLGQTGSVRGRLPVRVPDRGETPETPESDTPEEPATPEPPAAPEDAPVEARIAAITADAPSYVQSFDEDPLDWVPSTFDDTYSGVEDGELVVVVDAPGALGWTLLNQRPADLYLEVDATHLEGSTVAEYGILFRYVDAQNFYFFAISATGEFSLWRLRESNWEAIQDWTAADAIVQGSGAVNTLGILAEGEAIALLVNDTVVLDVTDDAFPSGGVGLALGTFTEGGIAVGFDNFSLWALGAEATTLPAETGPALPTAEAEEEDLADAAARIDEISAAEPTLTDDFRRDQGNWDTAPTDQADFFFARRALHIQVLSDYWIAWTSRLAGPDEPAVFSDFYAETDISWVSQPGPISAGLVFRIQDSDNFYTFGVNADGTYTMKKSVDGDWYTVIDPTASDAIEVGEDAVNRIGVLAEGSTIVLNINGEVVAAVEDDDISAGEVALAAEAFDEPDVEAAFDNFAIWDLSQ
jgi:hypothetical protein